MSSNVQYNYITAHSQLKTASGDFKSPKKLPRSYSFCGPRSNPADSPSEPSKTLMSRWKSLAVTFRLRRITELSWACWCGLDGRDWTGSWAPAWAWWRGIRQDAAAGQVGARHTLNWWQPISPAGQSWAAPIIGLCWGSSPLVWTQHKPLSLDWFHLRGACGLTYTSECLRSACDA